MKRNANSRSLGPFLLPILLASVSLSAILTIQAQTPPAGSLETPKAHQASAEKRVSAKSASAPEASKSSDSAPAASKTPASNTRTSTAPSKPQKLEETSTGVVWVNTASGVYHKAGSRWYGKTKKGIYMPEADAIKAGYKAAKN